MSREDSTTTEQAMTVSRSGGPDPDVEMVQADHLSTPDAPHDLACEVCAALSRISARLEGTIAVSEQLASENARLRRIEEAARAYEEAFHAKALTRNGLVLRAELHERHLALRTALEGSE